MTRIPAALALAVAMASTAGAQEEEVKVEVPTLQYTDALPAELAHGIFAPEFGLRAGYIKPRDADDGTWFGGIQVRVPLGSVLALEGSIELHTSDFESGDIEVVQYPVQASLLVFLLPDSPICPYVLGGLGWYYTTVDFSGSLDGLDSETDKTFGGHLGFGGRLSLGSGMTLCADLRYLFIDPDEDALEEEDFDSYQLVLSLGFPF